MHGAHFSSPWSASLHCFARFLYTGPGQQEDREYCCPVGVPGDIGAGHGQRQDLVRCPKDREEEAEGLKVGADAILPHAVEQKPGILPVSRFTLRAGKGTEGKSAATAVGPGRFSKNPWRMLVPNHPPPPLPPPQSCSLHRKLPVWGCPHALQQYFASGRFSSFGRGSDGRHRQQSIPGAGGKHLGPACSVGTGGTVAGKVGR